MASRKVDNKSASQAQQPPEVVSGGGEDGVDRVAGWSGEVVATHPMFAFGVADDRFDGGASAQLAFDVFGDAPPLAGDIDLEAMIGRRIVAAVATVGDDAR